MTQGSGMDQPSYSLPPVHSTSPWKLLVRPCLAAGSEDLSSVALVLHRFSLNKPGFLVGACARSSLLSSQWGLELSFSLLRGTPRESSMPLSCPELPPMAEFLPWVPASTCTCHLLPASFLLPCLPTTYENWKPFWALWAPPRSVGATCFVSLKLIFLCIPNTSARVQAHIISCFSYYNSNPVLLPPCLLSLHPISKFQPMRKLP